MTGRFWFPAAFSGNRIFAFGGYTASDHETNDLWKFTTCPSYLDDDSGEYVDCNECKSYEAYNKSSGSCYPCGPGTYSTIEHQDCFDCSIGTYSPGNATSCSICLSGTYSNNSRSYECIECEIGTYTYQNGASTCSECPMGRFGSILFPRSSVDHCQYCTPGYYSSENGSEDCSVSTKEPLALPPRREAEE